MRVVLLAAVVVTLSSAFPSDSKNPILIKWNITFERVLGRLSDSNKQALQKAMQGINVETRRQKLLSLNEKISRIRVSPEKTEEIKEKLRSIRPIKTERPNENTLDLFELNEKEGVDEYMFQGDIHLTESQMEDIQHEISIDSETLEGSEKRAKRQATTQFPKWTNKIVYYYFDPTINARKKASVLAAHRYIQLKTCVGFAESKVAKNRIRVFSGPGCFSNIGMTGGEQELSLGDGCEVIGTVAHEFTHALGVWHTQMRSDRDTYVTIDLSKVAPSTQSNFAKLQPNQMTAFTPYEYGSFMHYGANAFVKNQGQLSIIPKDTEYTYTMGNRQISFYDIKMINDFYGCSSLCPAATSAKCQNGGVPNPRNCAICNCPLGYGGNLCNQRPAGCGESLTATNVWKTVQFSFGNTKDNQNVRDDFTFCNHWITAPAGMKVQTKITSMFNPQCQYGCPVNGIEIKRKADKQVTNPRYCCPEFNNVVMTSSLNPTPIISYNRYYYTTFQVQYRYVPGDTPVPTTKSPTTPKTTRTSPTTTSRVTTARSTAITPPASSSTCADSMPTANCIANKAAGFCSSLGYSFQIIKYNCARTCGFCGKAAPNCVDLNADCAQMKANGSCLSMKPLIAEYQCARTCGFCTNPV